MTAKTAASSTTRAEACPLGSFGMHFNDVYDSVLPIDPTAVVTGVRLRQIEIPVAAEKRWIVR